MRFESILDAITQSKKPYFRISRTNGEYRCDDPVSFYADKVEDDRPTFDISNNKALANVAPDGSLKFVTFYRACYEVDHPLSGVWYFNDYTRTGPYYLLLHIDDKFLRLIDVDWPLTTSLMGNIFPFTTIEGEALRIQTITYAPISEDGSVRLPCIIYGVWIENTGSQTKTIAVSLAKLEPSQEDPVSIQFADDMEYGGEVSFDVEPNESQWIPFVVSMIPTKKQFDQVNERSSLDWLQSTWRYFLGGLGRLEISDDQFVQAFFERCVMQCFGSIGMTANGGIAGANLGTYLSASPIWMKDMYYAFLPFCMFEPDLIKGGILWFLERSVRAEGMRYKGGINHSLSNSLTPVILSGLYYVYTADKGFFLHNPGIQAVIKRLLDDVAASRTGDVLLFPSDWISDGPSRGDYHTGSNVVAWFCFQAAAKIMNEVYDERAVADGYGELARRIKAAIIEHNVIEGPFGPQFIEGVNADGSVPEMCHDGEESDTTLMPFYGFTGYDDLRYHNHKRFALSEHNSHYVVETKGIKWFEGDVVYGDATFPGYVSGFAAITNAEEMNGKDGYLTRIRELTDVDGSVWWWPYGEGGRFGSPVRKVVKCAWASGVFASHFVSSIIGFRYDAPERKVTFRPYSPSSDFRWSGLRFGTATFDITYERRDSLVSASLKNDNDFEIIVEYELILTKDARIKKTTINGAPFNEKLEYSTFFGRTTVKISCVLSKDEKKECMVLYA